MGKCKSFIRRNAVPLLVAGGTLITTIAAHATGTDPDAGTLAATVDTIFDAVGVVSLAVVAYKVGKRLVSSLMN